MPREVYLVWFFERGFVTNECAGGAYTYDHEAKQPRWDEDAATEYPTAEAAKAAMDAAELGELGKDYEIVPTVRANL